MPSKRYGWYQKCPYIIFWDNSCGEMPIRKNKIRIEINFQFLVFPFINSITKGISGIKINTKSECLIIAAKPPTKPKKEYPILPARGALAR